MKVAVVHGLQRGGAARRMAGTVAALPGLSDVDLREFSLAGSLTVLPDSVHQVDWVPQAPAKSRPLRPLWRYVDVVGARTAWSRLWSEVNAWGADVVFANPCFVPGGAPPRLARSAAPVLYYCDEPRRVDYEKDAARASNPVTRLPYAAMRRVHRHDERASVFAAAALATNSSFTAGRIERAYGRPAEVVTPGIAELFTTDPAGFEPAHHPRSPLLSVGTLIPSKGHDLVIAAASAGAPGRPVVVVAPRPNPEESARLTAQALALGVELDIRLGITDQQLAELYRSAFATLYLAREEPLGLVSFEAQACGSPVVVADDGGLVETVEDGVSGYHVARTAESAATALGRLADPDRWRSMARAAVTRPIPRDRDSARAVLSILQQLAGPRAVSGASAGAHHPGAEVTT